jgi:hypothetical protein
MPQESKRRPQEQGLLQICVNLEISSNKLADHYPQFENHYYTEFFYWSCIVFFVSYKQDIYALLR